MDISWRQTRGRQTKERQTKREAGCFFPPASTKEDKEIDSKANEKSQEERQVSQGKGAFFDGSKGMGHGTSDEQGWKGIGV